MPKKDQERAHVLSFDKQVIIAPYYVNGHTVKMKFVFTVPVSVFQ